VILAALLTLALTSPAPLVRCVTACLERGSVLHCFYDLEPACHPSQSLCQDSPALRCVPRAVNLGTWSPVLLTYSPAPYTGP